MIVCMFVLNNCQRDSRVLKEAKALADAGHDVRIIAVLDEDTEVYKEQDGFKIIRVSLWGIYQSINRAICTVERLPIVSLFPRSVLRSLYRRLPVRGLRRLVRICARPLALGSYWYHSWKVIKQEAADIYHCHDLTTLPVGYVAKRRTKGKLVYDSHELFTELHYFSRVERLFFGVLEKALIHHADVVIATNEFAAAELSQHYGIDLPQVVMNSPAYIRTNKRNPNGLREHLGLGTRTPIVIYSGGFQRDRGLEKLVVAATFLNEGILVFLGWGRLEQLLRNLVVERGLGNKVFFCPPVPSSDVSEYISSANVGVISTLNVSLNQYYTSPNKLFEYINAGLPVVGSNLPVLKSIIEGYRLGKTCDPENPQDIAAAINWVLSDKQRYEAMKRGAWNAAKIFNWGNESKKLMGIYRGLQARC